MNNFLTTVFGGTGFLGRHTVRALARSGCRIRVAVRRPNDGFFLRPMGQVGQIDIVKCDVRNSDQIAAAVHGTSAVVNLTGILYQRGKQSFDAVHVGAADAIAKAASAAGAHSLVHVSAIGADRDARSRYASTKGEGEVRVRAAFPDAVILRPSIVFGPEDDFFNRFAALARMIPFLPLVGGGVTKFQPVFVGDVAAAIVRAIADPGARGRTFELGGPAVYTFKELMQFVLRETGRRRMLVPLPYFVASIQAVFLQFMPKPMLTPDQVILLKSDNIVSAPDTFASLGIDPTSIEAEVPTYLGRFRPRGQYDDAVRAKVIETPAPR